MLLPQDEAAVEAAQAHLAGRDPDGAAMGRAGGEESTSGSDSDSDDDGGAGVNKERGGPRSSLPEGSGSRSPAAQAGSEGAELRCSAGAHACEQTRRVGSKKAKRRKIQEL